MLGFTFKVSEYIRTPILRRKQLHTREMNKQKSTMLQASGSAKSMLAISIILTLINCSDSFSIPNVQLSFTRSYHHFDNPSTHIITKASGCLPAKVRSQKGSSVALAMSSSEMIASLHTNNNFIMSVLTLLAGAGIAMEKNTQVGKAISVSGSKKVLSHCYICL